MNIEDADKKVGQLDKLFTNIETVLKKHWVLIILMLICSFLYYVFTLPEDQTTQPSTKDTVVIITDSVSHK